MGRLLDLQIVRKPPPCVGTTAASKGHLPVELASTWEPDLGSDIRSSTSPRVPTLDTSSMAVGVPPYHDPLYRSQNLANPGRGSHKATAALTLTGHLQDTVKHFIMTETGAIDGGSQTNTPRLNNIVTKMLSEQRSKRKN